MNKVVQEFIEFCNKQDPNRKIDHLAWDTCAAGDYADSINKSVNPIVDTFIQHDRKLFFKLALRKDRVDTYGDLQKYLKEREV